MDGDLEYGRCNHYVLYILIACIVAKYGGFILELCSCCYSTCSSLSYQELINDYDMTDDYKPRTSLNV